MNPSLNSFIMKRYYVLSLLTLFPFFCMAQSNSVSRNFSPDDTPNATLLDEQPEFPGGRDALFTYLSSNVHYPESAHKKGIQGRTICQFVVNKDGSIVDVEVIRSAGNIDLDKEAVRVISNMPNWKPGMIDGKTVRVKYTIPINFSLN